MHKTHGLTWKQARDVVLAYEAYHDFIKDAETTEGLARMADSGEHWIEISVGDEKHSVNGPEEHARVAALLRETASQFRIKAERVKAAFAPEPEELGF